MAGPKKQRVFIHYVLGKMLLLFFLCHPGTLATCDGQAYLRNRYANRDLVKTEAELEDHRRHYKPRDASEFAMRIGVPDEILHGDVAGYTPDWTPSLEQRFRDTVMSWIRKGRTPAAQQGQPIAPAPASTTTASTAAAHAATRSLGLVSSPPPALPITGPADAAAASRAASRRTAFVFSSHALGSDARRRCARELARQRWVSITEVGRAPRKGVANIDGSRRVSALARRCSIGGCPGYGGSSDRRRSSLRGCSGSDGPQMMLGRFRNRRIPLRRGIFGGGSAETDGVKNGSDGGGFSGSGSGTGSVTGGGSNNSKYGQAQIENDRMVATPMTLKALEQDPELLATSGSSGGKSSVISSLIGGAADAYDSALSFVGCALVTSPLGKRYLSGASDGYNTVSTIRRTGGGPADVSSGSAYDLVGFSNIDPFEASGRGGGRSNRLLG